ncbi:MAG TPA: hypothetical protein VFV50_12415 [Bdellovibrionales bacterium]|nr:hypothetical protein [Bdellovibrionales bacterium]
MPRAILFSFLIGLAALLSGPGAALAATDATLYESAELPGEGPKLGLGLALGSASSVTAQIWTTHTQAIVLGIGSTQAANTWLYADYLWHVIELSPRVTLLPYLGGGLGAGLNRKFDAPRSRDSDFYARVPLGFAWYPERVSIGVFAEVIPTAALAQTFAAYLDAAVGVRYFF